MVLTKEDLQTFIKEMRRAYDGAYVIKHGVQDLSDVFEIAYTVTTETEANALTDSELPYIFECPNEYTDAVTIALAWDSNTSNNYKISLNIEGVLDLSKTKFKSTPPSANNFNWIEGYRLRMMPGAKIRVNGYNYNGATSNASLVFFFLGDLKGDSDA